MVSTRRSRSTAGDGNSAEQDASVESLSQQCEVSSTRTRKSTVVAAHVVLEPVVEEPAAATVVSASAAQEDRKPTQDLGEHSGAAEQLLQTGTPSQLRQQQQKPQSQRKQQPSPARPTRHGWQPMQQQQQMIRTEEQSVPEITSSGADFDAGIDSDAAEWDFDGPDMLQNLAATIRSALKSTAGTQQQQQHNYQKQKHKHIAAAAGEGSHDGIDPESLKWRPLTGLHLPHKAGQLLQSAVAVLPPKQQHELASSGPIVQVLHSAATAELGSAADPAATAVATKPQGLGRHTHVPTLDPAAAAKEARAQKPETAGKKWYDLPAVKVTDEVKRDLRLLRLRGAYDPKRFYRSFDETKFPKHFAVGTVVDDPLDFYGGRLSKGQRKTSLTEQLLADSELTNSRKKRYNKLQEDANKWVKHKKRKTNMPRKTPSKHRPKH